MICRILDKKKVTDQEGMLGIRKGVINLSKLVKVSIETHAALKNMKNDMFNRGIDVSMKDIIGVAVANVKISSIKRRVLENDRKKQKYSY